MLCLQTHVESTLQIDFTNDPEDVITYLIEGADQAIKTYLGRAIEEATYTNEIYDSPWGREILVLREHPVTAVASVVEDGEALTEGDDYQWYSSGKLVRISGTRAARWKEGRKILDVTYTAGFNPVPTDLRNICANMVARWFDAGATYAATPDAASGAITSVSLEGSDSIDYAEPPEMESVGHMSILTDQEMAFLGKYRRAMRL